MDCFKIISGTKINLCSVVDDNTIMIKTNDISDSYVSDNDISIYLFA